MFDPESLYIFLCYYCSQYVILLKEGTNLTLKPPALPSDLSAMPLEDAVLSAVETEETISGALFEGDALPLVDTAMLDFSRCVFRRVRFEPCEVDRVHFADCHFEACDLSGFQFREGTLSRVAFDNCRASGALFSRMGLRDARFERCQLNYASFVDCKLQTVAFEDCQMAHALLHGCRQKGLSLERCELTQAEFIETRLEGVDLSSCPLDGLRTSQNCLAGATIGLSQAPAVLALFGVRARL